MTITTSWDNLTSKQCDELEKKLEIGTSIGDATKPLYKILSKKIKKTYISDCERDAATGEVAIYNAGLYNIEVEMEVEPI